jgi:hypothetical protein
MDGTGEFLRQRGVDAALALHPGQTFEGRRNKPDVEMGFALTAILARSAAMPGMAGAFIAHLQQGRREGRHQFVANGGGYRHARELLLAWGKVKQYVFLSFTVSIP